MKTKLTADQVAAVRWFIDHLSFSDYQQSVPPHLGDAVLNRAYFIRDALSALEKELPSVSASDWMYRS